MARKKRNDTARTEHLSAQSIALAEFAAKALIAGEQLGIKKKPVDGFPLDYAERALAAKLPSLPALIKKKLAKGSGAWTLADVARVVMAVAESVLDGEPLHRFHLLLIAKKLMDCLETNVVSSVPGHTRSPKSTGTVYQFKVTLLGVKPPIWRRIQIKDGTLDKLHEHVQTAMGWTNSHLHQFEIKGVRYGDPELLADDFADFEGIDSTRTMLSEVLSKTAKRLSFKYEYDFGDGWEHEVLFEGRLAVTSKPKYPLCLEGERACPPEDCGGVWGYADFLEAIRNKEHEEHDNMLEWVGGWFDSEEFDANTATKAMQKGLPDWRSEAW